MARVHITSENSSGTECKGCFHVGLSKMKCGIKFTSVLDWEGLK